VEADGGQVVEVIGIGEMRDLGFPPGGGRGDPQVVEQCAATDEDLPAGRVGGARCPVRLEEDLLSPFALNPP